MPHSLIKPISTIDTSRNSDELSRLLMFSELDQTAHGQLLKKVTEQILAFINQNNLIIYANVAKGESNLTAAEIEQLRQIARDAVRSELANTDKLVAELTAWRDTLQHAMPGGVVAKLHDSQNSLTRLLAQKGRVKLSEWGDQEDIANCFGDKCILPANITVAGSYIITPRSSSVTMLQQVIDDVVRDKAIVGTVNLLIPLLAKNHWRLATICIDNNAVSSARLWDPLADKHLKQKAVYTDLNHAINNPLSATVDQPKIVAKAIAAGIQQNSHSCMDYVVQKIYHTLTVSNAITQAENASELRLAVMQQIANNTPSLGKQVADALYLSGDAIEIDTVELTEEQEKFRQGMSKGGSAKDLQEKFDIVFAKTLNDLQGRIKDDKKLQNRAFLQAFTIFRQQKDGEQNVKLVVEVASTTLKS